MADVEKNVALWGTAAIVVSGLFWIIPGVNAVTSIAAIAGVLLIVARLGFLRALPAAVAGSAAALAAGSLALGLQPGLWNSFFFLAAVFLPGAMMGLASRRLASPAATVFYGFIPLALLLISSSVFYVSLIRNLPLFLDDIHPLIISVIQQSPRLANMIAGQYSAPGNGIDEFLKEFDSMMMFAAKILPAIMTLAFLALIMGALALAGPLAARWKIMIPRFQPFHLWRAAGWWFLPTILGLVPVVFSKQDVWFYLGLNLLLVCAHVYAIVGLAVIEAFFRRVFVPVPLRVLLYIVLILANFLALALLAVIGLADTTFNFDRENSDNKDD